MPKYEERKFAGGIMGHIHDTFVSAIISFAARIDIDKIIELYL